MIISSTVGGSGKKRPLSNKSTLPKKIAELEIVCKVSELTARTAIIASVQKCVVWITQDLRKFRFILKKAEKSVALHVSLQCFQHGLCFLLVSLISLCSSVSDCQHP